jgi:hypothetical protein
MERRRNLFDKIGSYIRGYEGYVIREEKRNTDYKLREQLSKKIINTEKLIIAHQQQLISKNDIQTCQEWEIVRKALNTLTANIKLAPYGESSFFAENQLKENELEEIYNMDLQIAERIDLLCTLVTKHMNEVLTPAGIIQNIREVDAVIDKRAQFLKNFK